MEPALLAILNENASRIRVPGELARVEKDECVYTFDSPWSPNGLYTNLNDWKSYSREWVEKDSARTGMRVYFKQQFYKHYKPPKEDSEKSDADKKITKLALGVEGGFSGGDESIEIERQYYLAILPEYTLIPLDTAGIPSVYMDACNAIIANAGVSSHQAAIAFDEDYKESVCSKDLVQLEVTPDKKISPNPSDWKCAGCGALTNLWFNLSDGYIGCGRRQPDGSGGCGEAQRHYSNTGSKYPLAVKLGTITPQGGDVFSYAEDDMVIDSLLGSHLKHWGIDIMSLEKTEKTMEELQIDLNKKFVFGLITEEGKSLTKVTGPGFIGLENLGSSCYMNSLLQILMSLSETKQKYLNDSQTILNGADPTKADSDLITQFAKLSVGMLTDRYVRDTNEIETRERTRLNGLIKKECGDDTEKYEKILESLKVDGVKNTAVRPRLFKRIVGEGHPEFSSNRQQDVSEYVRHLFELIHRRERVCTRISKTIPGYKQLFQFKIEERLECGSSHKVRYGESEDFMLRVDVDLSAAINSEEVAAYQERVAKRAKLDSQEKGASVDKDGDTPMKKDGKEVIVIEQKDEEPKILPIIPFKACCDQFLRSSIVEGWLSPATGEKGTAIKSYRVKTFPKYLAIQVSRYYTNAQWLPEKHDVEIPMPLELDLEFMRAKGIQSGEEELPAKKKEAKSAGPVPDEMIVIQLQSMGFGANACKRAALAVSNSSAEDASNWLMMHLDDSDLNDPLPPPGSEASNDSGKKGFVPDPSIVSMLSMSLGFKPEHVEVALAHTKGDGDRAADWLFSHMSSLDESVSAMKAEMDAAKAGPPAFDDGPAKYKLFGFISHLGKATSHGHYVAHIKKGDDWIIFNDSKVAKSQETPFSHGYLYFYQRISSE